jgi:hypothetical protein
MMTASVATMSMNQDDRPGRDPMDKLLNRITDGSRRLGRNEVVVRTASGGTLVVATHSGAPARRWRPRPARP